MIFNIVFSGRFVFLLVIWAFLSSLIIFRGTYTGFVQFKPMPGWDIAPIVTVTVRPDFSQIEDVGRKKQAFFEYLAPFIEQANDQVLQVRLNIIQIHNKAKAGELSPKEKQYIQTLAGVYRCPQVNGNDIDLVNELLKRVDVVPASLALAQAANETAWGTSRFAVDGNNYFGIWCFSKGCGLVPNGRSGNAIHEVAKFSSPADSVSYYIKQLNSNSNYQLLRDIREQARQNGAGRILGADLANGLEKYSAIGLKYVASIKSIIRVNKLDQFDFVIR
ncbi:MAG: hypothetical protein D6B28_09945 [Gammaproteobacteria bacterium]|nr:MAG: hypothetical protein D6B28_09945 [Gammaproteobacteria bacterium]